MIQKVCFFSDQPAEAADKTSNYMCFFSEHIFCKLVETKYVYFGVLFCTENRDVHVLMVENIAVDLKCSKSHEKNVKTWKKRFFSQHLEHM